jgi:hypothetical protein
MCDRFAKHTSRARLVSHSAWRTVFGAVLLSGYLGGAIATHVRVGKPFVLAHALERSRFAAGAEARAAAAPKSRRTAPDRVGG